MTEPTFGVTFEQRNDEYRSVAGGDFSTVALVGPAPAADPSVFPLNEPVPVYSNDATKLAKLGTERWLRDAVEGINDQLGEFQRAAKVCIVRTPHSAAEEAQDRLEAELLAIAGDSTAMTGLHALKGAASHIGYTPRMVCVPGYTHQLLGEDEANVVVAELPSVLDHLFAVSVVEGPKGSVEDAIAWRETFSSKRLIPVVGGMKVRGGAGETLERPLAPRVLGLGVRVDHEHDGMPFHSFANRPLSGIVAPGWDHSFSLVDGANEGQDLLAAGIGIVERGEMGVDDAIADAGFVFIGTDHADTTLTWPFYHQTRGNDWIWLSELKTIRNYLGRSNVTLQAVQACVNQLNKRLRMLEADSHLYKGSRIRFDPDQNGVDEIREGRITLDPVYEIPSVWRRAHLRTTPNRAAVEVFVKDLAEALTRLAA
jgi:phage tail sheath protein FI